MKNIYEIENTVFIQQYAKRFFVFCLFKQPKLFKYVLPHIIAGIAYALHIMNKVSYYNKYWSFLKDIDVDKYVQAFGKNAYCKDHTTLDSNGVYIAYAPRSFVSSFSLKSEVYCLEDMSNEKNHLRELMRKHKITSYATVDISDKQLKAQAQKCYYIKKGKLFEETTYSKLMKHAKLFGILAILSLCITFFVLALTPSSWILVAQLIVNPLVVFVNFIPVFFVMMIVFGIINTVRGSFIVTSIFFIILVEINRFKISFRDDPFVYLDLEYASEATQMMNNYTLYIDFMTFIILITFLLATIYLGYTKIDKNNSKILRVLLIILPVITFPLIYKVVYLDTNMYDILWNDNFGNQWKEANQFIARGFNYSFIRSYNVVRWSEPDDYNKQEVVDKLQTYENIDMIQSQKVNIISIMLEAYNDFSVSSPTAEIDPSVYKNMHEIKENSYSGFLYTDIFAGGTVVSERSFLTGYSLLGDFRHPTNSYVSYFKKQGYYTEAMHPCYGWFYNRQNINRIGLGFDNFDHHLNKYEEMITNGEVEDTFAGFLRDGDFFNQIIEGFEKNKMRGVPYFNYSLTYQNHGPYSGVAQGDEQYLKWKDTYNESDYHTVNNYLANIKDTDEALKQLYTYINAQPEPIILVLYGDHNPLLGEGNSGFDLLNMNLELDTIEGGQNYYQTPYVISANQSAKDALGSSFQGVGNTISPMFLMNEVFEVANMNAGSAYSQYLKELKQKIDVINPTYIKKDNVFMLKNEYIDDGTLAEFYNLQYYEQDSSNYRQ